MILPPAQVSGAQAQTFAMIDVDRAEALFPAFVAATAGEAGALFYSMARGGPAAGDRRLERDMSFLQS